MGSVSIRGIESTRRELMKEVALLEKKAVAETLIGARVLTECLMDQTPVWEGTAVRNFVWAAGRMPSGGEKPALGSGDPGPTGSMGSPPAGEPRRGANESAALTDMETALRGVKKLTDLFCSNTSAHWDLVDSGSAPTGDRARNPGGVSNIAMMLAKSQLVNFK